MVGKEKERYPHGMMHYYTGWVISMYTASDTNTENMAGEINWAGRE